MSSAGRVLIIDDDPFIQELLCESLAPLGYQCAVAERGQQALELLRTGRFDVAILDIMLPEINGIEILRRVQNKIPHTEIIVLTGHASLETAIESLRLGAYDYATKPFSIDAIRTTIKRAIEKQRLETRLAAIQDLSREMTLSLDVERVAEAVLDIVTRVLELEHCELFSLDRERNELSPLMVRSVLETPLPCLPLNGDKGITVAAARSGEPLYVPDTRRDPRYLPTRHGMQSELAVPLKVQERVIGVLNVESSKQDAFGPSDVQLLCTLAAQAAVAMENARLYAQAQREIAERARAETEIKRRNEELAALNDIGQAVTSTLNLQETLTLITFHTTRLLDVAGASLLLRDQVDDDLLFVASSGGDTDLVLSRRMPIGEGIAGWVAQTGEPLIVPNVAQDPRWFSDFDAQGSFVTQSILCVPLQSKGQTIGVLEAINKNAGAFDEDDLRLLSSLAVPAATAIENARLFDEVRIGREQLQALSRRLVEVQEAERSHISREIHDETGQILSSLLLGLSLLERQAHRPEAVVARATELEEMIDELLENLHRLAMNLRPATLDHLGLVAALEQYVESYQKQHGLTVQLETVGLAERRLPPTVETTLYRVVQEALTNVARHAQASRVDVLLEQHADRLVLVAEDDGVGFELETIVQSNRLGLLGMRERAEMLGGKLVIESAAGKGTSIFVEIPAPWMPA